MGCMKQVGELGSRRGFIVAQHVLLLRNSGLPGGIKPEYLCRTTGLTRVRVDQLTGMMNDLGWLVKNESGGFLVPDNKLEDVLKYVEGFYPRGCAGIE